MSASDGVVVLKPDGERGEPAYSASRRTNLSGTPLTPEGDPMLSRVGPGAFALRAHVPDMMLHGGPKIVPLRVAPEFDVDGVGSDPRGMTVLGADGQIAGVITDLWIDKAEYMIRYLEVELSAPEPVGVTRLATGPMGRRVLLPMTMAAVNKRSRTVRVDAILASQFAGVPPLEQADQITLDEEERVCAYYGGGYLYATPMRAEPLI
jgi:photosynthetic reaction center H subunit